MIKHILSLFFFLIVVTNMPLMAKVNDSHLSGPDTAYFNYTATAQQFADLTVSIFSPSNVTSLDFSIRINPANLVFDTLLINASYLDAAFAYYDTIDSTLRFSSFSLQQYQIQVPLLTVRFIKLNPLTAADFNPIKAYINGESAETKLNMPVTGISDITGLPGFITYPNPAKSFLNIVSERKLEITLIDFSGRMITNPTEIETSKVNTLDFRGIKPGIYFLRAVNKEINISREIIVTQ